jgi:hypothetical protein
MREAFVRSHTVEKLKDLGVLVCTILADNLLLIVWIGAEYCLEHYIVPRINIESVIERVAFWTLRVIFAASTVIPSLIFTYRDVRIMWIRSQTEIKMKQKAMEAEVANSLSGLDTEGKDS